VKDNRKRWFLHIWCRTSSSSRSWVAYANQPNWPSY